MLLVGEGESGMDRGTARNVPCVSLATGKGTTSPSAMVKIEWSPVARTVLPDLVLMA